MSVEPDHVAVTAFWDEYCAATGTSGRPDDVFAFGDSPAMADALVELVLAGIKTATAGSIVEYDAEGIRPFVGALSVACRGDGTPAAVLRTTETRVGRLSSVTEDFAWDEGEGDRTRDWWIDGHRAYFRRTFAIAGIPYDDDPRLMFERFEVVWPGA